jgi:hypothetical protein
MKKVGGLLTSLVKLVLPKFGDALQRVQDLAHVAGDFYDKWKARLLQKAEAQWKAAKKRIDGAEKVLAKREETVEKAREKLGDKRVSEAAAQGPAKARAAKERQAAQDALKAAEAARKAARTALDNVRKAARKKRKIDGSGDLLNPILDDLVKRVTARVVATIEPGARNLLSQGFKFVRSVLDPIAQSVISALAGIPFVGGALAALGQVAYSLGMNYLEEAAFDALRGIVERILAKMVKTAVTPVFKVVQKKLLALVQAACASGPLRAACPAGGELKFAAMPARDRWLGRALACKPPPVFDDRLRRDAVLARRRILGTAVEMRREVAAYARDLADRYLAQYGITYDGWMAAVAQGATPRLVARAGEISRGLRAQAGEIESRLGER